MTANHEIKANFRGLVKRPNEARIITAMADAISAHECSRPAAEFQARVIFAGLTAFAKAMQTPLAIAEHVGEQEEPTSISEQTGEPQVIIDPMSVPSPHDEPVPMAYFPAPVDIQRSPAPVIDLPPPPAEEPAHIDESLRNPMQDDEGPAGIDLPPAPEKVE